MYEHKINSDTSLVIRTASDHQINVANWIRAVQVATHSESGFVDVDSLRINSDWPGINPGYLTPAISGKIPSSRNAFNRFLGRVSYSIKRPCICCGVNSTEGCIDFNEFKAVLHVTPTCSTMSPRDILAALDKNSKYGPSAGFEASYSFVVDIESKYLCAPCVVIVRQLAKKMDDDTRAAHQEKYRLLALQKAEDAAFKEKCEREIMLYQVVSMPASDAPAFSKASSDLMHEGFIPWGSPLLTSDNMLVQSFKKDVVVTMPSPPQKTPVKKNSWPRRSEL
jgi:hypothetical protein